MFDNYKDSGSDSLYKDWIGSDTISKQDPDPTNPNTD